MTIKGFNKFIPIYPWLFLIYFFVLVKTGGYFPGLKKEDVIAPFLLGIMPGSFLLLPAWIYSSAYSLGKEPHNKKSWVHFSLFLVPSILLFWLLKQDPFCFWGCIVD